MSGPGLVCALPREARAFGRVRGRGPHSMGAGELIVSGIGAEHARIAAATLIARGAQCLISFGLCAGLDPQIRAGEVLVASEVLAADGSRVACDPRWRAAVAAALGVPKAGEAVIACAAQVLAEPAQKARLAAASGAVAADMESGAIAAAARAAGLPMLAVRVVFDDARTALPAPLLAALDATGRVRPTRWPLLVHPAVLRRLPALARAARAAERGLARAARALERAAALVG